MRRYSRYSRYRTKSHDKATISNDITRYSRYQTVLLKLKEIIIISYIQKLCFGRAFCYCRGDSRIALFICDDLGGRFMNRPYEYLRSHFQRIQSQEPLIYRARFALIKKGGSICKELSRPICFLPFLWYNTTNR